MCHSFHEMNSPRITVSRWSATLLLLAAWFVASNHCALAFEFALVKGGISAASASAEPEHAHCPGHPQKGKKSDSDSSTMQCCTSLPALPAGFAKAHVGFDGSFFALHINVIESLLLDETQHNRDPAELDTGPPREARSFAELVLQRSLHSLAPPTLS